MRTMKRSELVDLLRGDPRLGKMPNRELAPLLTQELGTPVSMSRLNVVRQILGVPTEIRPGRHGIDTLETLEHIAACPGSTVESVADEFGCNGPAARGAILRLLGLGLVATPERGRGHVKYYEATPAGLAAIERGELRVKR